MPGSAQVLDPVPATKAAAHTGQRFAVAAGVEVAPDYVGTWLVHSVHRGGGLGHPAMTSDGFAEEVQKMAKSLSGYPALAC
jgi:hypothetical protein